MKPETAAFIRQLRSEGKSDVAIQGELARRPKVITVRTESRERPADVVAMEQGAIAVANRLLAAVRPDKTFADMQALPISAIMAAVDAKAATADIATKAAILEDVARLTVLYNALTAHGSNWRSPLMGQESESVDVREVEETASFVEANDDTLPTLHEIREAR